MLQQNAQVLRLALRPRAAPQVALVLVHGVHAELERLCDLLVRITPKVVVEEPRLLRR